MPNEPSSSEHGYIIDAESAVEMARLMNQDHIVTEDMGGLFPERSDADLAAISNILDIGCGPGGWVLNVARRYPEINVVGIDISRTMVEYAHAQARARGLHNASFKVMDALKPLQFSANNFDLINARFITSFMPKRAWPRLIEECLRITGPGGTIRLTESEAPITTSPAFEEFGAMFTRALRLTGQGFSPDGRQIAITAALGQLLRNAGCKHVQKMAHAIDFSIGSAVYESYYQNFVVTLELLKPLFLKLKLTTDEGFDHLFQQMLIEVQSDDFSAIWHYVTFWGQKARA